MDQLEESYFDQNYLFSHEEPICKNATVGHIEEESFPYSTNNDKSLIAVFECLTIANNQQNFTSPYHNAPDNMQKLALELGNTSIGRRPSYVPIEEPMMEIEEHVAKSAVGSLKTAEKGKEHK